MSDEKDVKNTKHFAIKALEVLGLRELIDDKIAEDLNKLHRENEKTDEELRQALEKADKQLYDMLTKKDKPDDKPAGSAIGPLYLDVVQ